MSALSVGYGCSIKPARGTRNFNLKFWFVWQPAQIHIHVHMRLAGTSLCRRCLEAGKILSAPNSPYHAFEVDGQCSYDIKYRKVCLFALLWLLYPPALLLNKGKIFSVLP